MFHKLVRNVMIAAIIHGSDAKCEDNSELMAYMRSSISAACLPFTVSDTGEPPACAANNQLCGMLTKIDYLYECVGSGCSTLSSAFKFGETQSQTMPQQVCFPTACKNDADMAVFSNFTQHMMQNSMCNSMSSRSSSTTNADGLEASIDTQVSAKDAPQMSCEKDAQGQIVIDGVVIPTPAPSRCEPCDGADGCGNFYSETECKSASQGCDWDADACPEYASQTGTPIDATGDSMTTCGDMKRAYKMAGCCGNPTKTFTIPDGMKRRRLSSEEELLESVKAALQNAKEVGGPSKAKSLAKAMGAILSKLD
jgi:hypothetical protein